jgi:hypothetical protein
MFTTSDSNHCFEIRSADVLFSALSLETPILDEGDELTDKNFKQDIGWDGMD